MVRAERSFWRGETTLTFTAMNKSKVHWQPPPQTAEVHRFCLCHWGFSEFHELTSHSHTHSCAYAIALKKHTHASIKSPPPRVSVGTCWKIWVLAPQCLVRSWRPNSPDWTTAPRGRTCTKTREGQAKLSHPAGRRGSLLLRPTNIRN